MSSRAATLLLILGFVSLFYAPHPLYAKPTTDPFLKAYQDAVNADKMQEFLEQHLGPGVDSHTRSELVHRLVEFLPNTMSDILGSVGSSMTLEPYRSEVAATAFKEIKNLPTLTRNMRQLIRMKIDPQVAYQRGAELLKSAPDQASVYDSSQLFHLAKDSFGVDKIPQADLELFYRNGLHDPTVQQELIRRAPHADHAVLFSVFDGKGTFEDVREDRIPESIFSTEAAKSIKDLIREGKITITKPIAENLGKKIKDAGITPIAKVAVFDILQENAPDEAQRVWNDLLASKDPYDHLMADRLLAGDFKTPERQKAVVGALNHDVSTQKDPSVLSFLEESSFSKKLNFGQSFDPSLVRRLLDSPDEKMTDLAIRMIGDSPRGKELIPELLKSQLFGDPKRLQGLILTNGHNDRIAIKISDLLEKYPEQLKGQVGLLVKAMEDPNNTLVRKDFVYSLLEKANAEQQALPALANLLTRATDNEAFYLAQQIKKITDEHPEAYRSFEPKLTKALRESKNLNQQLAISQVMSHMGSKYALDFLAKVLEIPQSKNEPDANRSIYRIAAKAIGDSLQKHPTAMTESLREALGKVLGLKGAEYTAAQNDLRKFLPKAMLTEIEDKKVKEAVDPSNTDPCEVACRLSDGLSKALNQTTGEVHDRVVSSDQGKSAFDLAVKSLVSEFLLKANQMGCSGPQAGQQAQRILAEASKVASRKSEGPQLQDKRLKEVEAALRGMGPEEPGVKQALEFLKKSEGGIPTNSSSLYLMIHAHRLSQALKSDSHSQSSHDDSELQKKLEEQMSHIANARKGLDTGEEGSLASLYAIAAMGASMPGGSPLQKKVSDILLEMRKRINSNNKETSGAGFPYDFSGSSDRASDRASGARSVVAQLAIYKGDSKDNRLINADELLKSLDNYNLHFRDIFSGIGLNRTHDRYDQDQLAPYYGPSTIPYVFEALSALEQEKGMTTEQRSKLKNLREQITKKVLEKITPNGMFTPQNDGLYAAAHLYDNALVGLGLQNACQSSKPSGFDGNSNLRLHRGGQSADELNHQAAAK